MRARLKILPDDMQALLVDGAEALKQYPYGCLEQTYSSTIPNLFLYKYIAAKPQYDAKDAALLDELQANLKAGRDRLLQHYLNNDGGYSMWRGTL